MPNSQRHYTNSHRKETHLGQAATEFLREGKKVANDFYHGSLDRMHNVQDSVKTYSNEVAHQVERKPLLSLVVACGIGFILSSLFRR